MKTQHHLIALVALLLLTGDISAQLISQKIQLFPGWNAIYLEIQPDSSDIDSLLSNLPIESVWMWNRRSSSVQFVQDANSLVPENPDWLVYFPTNSGHAKAQSLFTILGGQTYLVKLKSPTSLVWTVTGKPVVLQKKWPVDSLDFTGFTLGTNQAPTFASFFQGSPAHAGQPVFRLNPAGNWERVAVPSSTIMRAGEAFWIRTQGASEFSGPIGVTLPVSTGLDFGRSLVESEVRVKNNSAIATRFHLVKRPAVFSSPSFGDISLNYWLFDQAGNRAGWVPLTNSITSPLLAPGGEWLVRFEVLRPKTAGANQISGYAGLLDITDQAGSVRIRVPASALTSSGAGAIQSLSTSPSLLPGLWIGSAILDRVSQPAAISNPETPTGSAGEFQLRILLHVDTSGVTRLLQKVLLMWKVGTTKTTPDGKIEVDTPGRYVVLTDDRLVPNFTGAALRDGEPVARRFSSAGFAMRTNLTMSGTFGQTLQCTNFLGYDDPLNPFKHKYHPDHDNYDENSPRVKLLTGQESFDIRRIITLEFTSDDPHHLGLAGWGQTQVGGLYRETLTGLHKQPINVAGTFRLQLASRVGILNDGL